jgi:hypothetical protein
LANGLISVWVVRFGLHLQQPSRNAGFGGRNGRREKNVTRNGTDLYFSAKFLKLSMIFGVILTSFGQAGSYWKGLLGHFEAKKGPDRGRRGREDL